MEFKKTIGKYISNLELGELLSSDLNKHLKVIDCRDTDFQGGHIKGC